MFETFIRIYKRILEILIMILMTGLLIAVTLQILGRYVPFIPRYIWTVEVVNITLIWVIFLGAAIGVKESRHFFVDFLPKNVGRGIEMTSRVLYYTLMFIITGVFIYYGYRFFLMGYVQESQATGLNLGVVYLSVPVAGVSWLLFLTSNLIQEIRERRHS